MFHPFKACGEPKTHTCCNVKLQVFSCFYLLYQNTLPLSYFLPFCESSHAATIFTAQTDNRMKLNTAVILTCCVQEAWLAYLSFFTHEKGNRAANRVRRTPDGAADDSEYGYLSRLAAPGHRSDSCRGMCCWCGDLSDESVFECF